MYDKELLELKKKLDKMLAPKTAEYKQGYKDGYAGAIDEFVERFMKEDSKHILDYNYYETIKEIAEQMKGVQE